jgi:SAM-dependent methyltransferase
MSAADENRRVSGEAAKSYALRRESGFFDRYLCGASILDVGFRGGDTTAVPITETAIGVDLDFPGYDGLTLPFANASQDAVFSSHCLEHISDPIHALREWFRVTKVGGFVIVIVPHQFLYEKKRELPSNWSGEHLRFYTPGSLMAEVEGALSPNSYRVRHLCDNDLRFDYTIGPDRHSFGCYEIELVLEKIPSPAWTLL